MAFKNARDTDARHATFNDVGGNQYNEFNLTSRENDLKLNPANVNGSSRMGYLENTSIDARAAVLNDVGRDQFNIQITICPTAGRATRPLHPSGMHPSLIILEKKLPIKGDIFSAVHPSTSGPSNDIATSLIGEILESLVGSDRCHDLREEFRILQKYLSLADHAIQAYEHTPLGPNIANSTSKLTEKCLDVLRVLLHTINSYRQGLDSTCIHNLWGKVLRNSDGLLWLRSQLSAHQQLLGECILVLNSASWQELGNRLRTGSVSLRDFRGLLRQGPVSLHHVQLSNITVLDHLGRNIPVPTIFCSTWEDFHIIISGLCKDVAGYQFVKLKDYILIRSEDKQIIKPSEFPDSVESGMTVEMSITLREVEDHQRKCPRCGDIYVFVAADSDWIECQHCGGLFQSTEPDGNQEIVSPASQHEGHWKPQDDEDDRRYFRRINIFKIDPVSKPPMLVIPPFKGFVRTDKERKREPSFRDFITNEKAKLQAKRRAENFNQPLVKRVAELKKFSLNFKLNTPINVDLLPILAKDEEKRKQIHQNSIEDANSSQARVIRSSRGYPLTFDLLEPYDD